MGQQMLTFYTTLLNQTLKEAGIRQGLQIPDNSGDFQDGCDPVKLRHPPEGLASMT